MVPRRLGEVDDVALEAGGDVHGLGHGDHRLDVGHRRHGSEVVDDAARRAVGVEDRDLGHGGG